jgi:hypothetical protein
MYDSALQSRWSRLAYVLVATVALLHGGCLFVAAGAAGGAALGYVYCKGNVCEIYASNLNDSWAATHTALAELGFPVVKEARENVKGWIECNAADGNRIRIHLDIVDSQIPAEGPVTRICVRVATFGDNALSERILNQVGAHLIVASPPPSGPAPPLATPEPPVAPPPPPTTRAASPAPQSGEPPLSTPPIRPPQ